MAHQLIFNKGQIGQDREENIWLSVDGDIRCVSQTEKLTQVQYPRISKQAFFSALSDGGRWYGISINPNT